VGVQTKAAVPHNCCYCVYTVVEGKRFRVKSPVDEWWWRDAPLYDRGRAALLVPRCRSSSPPAATSTMPKQFAAAIAAAGMLTSTGRPTSALTNLDQEHRA